MRTDRQAQGRNDGRTDRYDEDNNRFLQFCKPPPKTALLIEYLVRIIYLQEVHDNPKEIQENSMCFRHVSCQHKSTNHLDEGRNRRCVYENGVGPEL